MARAEQGARRSWIIGLAAGLAGVALVLALFRAPPAAPPVRPPPAAPAATLASEANREEAALFDPTPLFLPTPWNSSRKEAPPPEPRETLTGYPPKVCFDAGEPRLDLGAPIAVPATPADALAASPPRRPFLGFGRSGAPIHPLPSRGAFLEAFEAKTGRQVLALPLADADPSAPGGGWQPLEFLAAVDPAGLVGSLTLTAGSGSAAVDGYFLRYLQETVRVGERLRPGFYRVCVGP